MKEEWTYKDSKKLYKIDKWSNGYFKINARGNVYVHIKSRDKEVRKLDIYKLLNELLERGIRLPLIIRFPDIIASQIQYLYDCFHKAIGNYSYKGKYMGVYPIKVNQQKHLVQEIIRQGTHLGLGLECGSKPELLAALSLMKDKHSPLVCNGFKDQEYIETALLFQKSGRNIFIVVERMKELKLILKCSKKFRLVPKIGFRIKLQNESCGRWEQSCGVHSKFGLTVNEIIEGFHLIKKQRMLNCLWFLHFHMGSQVPDIQNINASIKEGARFFTGLYKLGAKHLKYIDVGGGFGVDYDGSKSSHSSVNYSPQEYANDVVSIIQSVCDEEKVPHPDIITESGRFLVAHHSVLIFDVLDMNLWNKKIPSVSLQKKDPQFVHDLQYTLQNMNEMNLNESYNDLMQSKNEIIQMFTYGRISLEERAKAENLFWKITHKMADMAGKFEKQNIYNALQEELRSIYFCNFSLFQSVPDSWALRQIFPVMPLHRLNEKPEHKALLMDLTCDSDGKMSRFISASSNNTSNKKNGTGLYVHTLKKQPYFVGVFLTGAYQEILGDLHNLFGDTDSVGISLLPRGKFNIDHYVPGDTVMDVLGYVQYRKDKMVNSMRYFAEQSILSKKITRREAKLLIRRYEEGLSGYTYFENKIESK